jgi:hypothetical protein
MFLKRTPLTKLEVHIDFIAMEIAQQPVAFFALLSKITTRDSAERLMKQLLRSNYRKLLEQSLAQPDIPAAVRTLIVETLNQADAAPSAFQNLKHGIAVNLKGIYLLSKGVMRLIWLAIRTSVSALA